MGCHSFPKILDFAHLAGEICLLGARDLKIRFPTGHIQTVGAFMNRLQGVLVNSFFSPYCFAISIPIFVLTHILEQTIKLTLTFTKDFT